MNKILLFAATSITLFVITVMQFLPTDELRISFLDIGQGDAIFIQTPVTGHTILVDGGPHRVIKDVLPEVLPFFHKHIDVMILTHPHADHVSGLLHVLDTTTVNAVLIAGIKYENTLYTHFLEKIYEKKIPVFVARSDHDFQVGPIIVDVVAPQTYLAFQSDKNINNTSIGIRITYAQKTVLLTGDAEHEQEDKMLRYGNNLTANIFKAGHHGSKTSSTPKMLAAVRPQIVIIQSGINNRYNHPHKETLTALEEKQVYRNDQDGTIHLAIDEHGTIRRL